LPSKSRSWHCLHSNWRLFARQLIVSRVECERLLANSVHLIALLRNTCILLRLYYSLKMRFEGCGWPRFVSQYINCICIKLSYAYHKIWVLRAYIIINKATHADLFTFVFTVTYTQNVHNWNCRCVGIRFAPAAMGDEIKRTHTLLQNEWYNTALWGARSEPVAEIWADPSLVVSETRIDRVYILHYLRWSDAKARTSSLADRVYLKLWGCPSRSLDNSICIWRLTQPSHKLKTAHLGRSFITEIKTKNSAHNKIL